MPLCNHVELRELVLVVAFALAFLLSMIVVSGFVGLVDADPFIYGVTFPSALMISTTSPQNNTVYPTNNLAVIFNVSVMGAIDMGNVGRIGESYLLDVYYSADWLQNDVIVFTRERKGGTQWWENCPTFSEHNADYLIPDGEHNLTIAANGWGKLYWGEDWHRVMLTGVSVINFTIDTAPPKISVLSLENKTYNAADAQLDFALNEPVSRISYVLDGSGNMTVKGNTTLADLSNGEHNVTVYATDLAGHVGVSETVYFSVEVPEPFPTLPVIAASVVAVIAGGVFLGYFKKRHN